MVAFLVDGEVGWTYSPPPHNNILWGNKPEAGRCYLSIVTVGMVPEQNKNLQFVAR